MQVELCANLLNCCSHYQLKTINDKTDYKVNCDAMKSVGFCGDETKTIWKIISAILHLVCEFVFTVNTPLHLHGLIKQAS